MGNSSGGARKRRRVALAWVILVLIVASTFFTLVVYEVLDEGVPSLTSLSPREVEFETASQGGTPVLIDVPLALLGDYYEHGKEHAPPRDPRGVMQRREDYYRPPQDPVRFLGTKLGRADGDRRLATLLSAWSDRWIRGQTSSNEQTAALEQSATQSSLDAIALLQTAQAFQFLEGDALAAALMHAGLTKAERQHASTTPGDPIAFPLLRQLDQTKALWNLKDYPALERRFRLARRLYPPWSIESRRAGYLLADALFYQGRFKEAESVVTAVMKEHLKAGDLGLLDHSDFYEMTYQLGYLQFSADDLEPAIENLRKVKGKGEHDRDVAKALFSALLTTGRFDEAATLRRDLTGGGAVTSSGMLALEQEKAMQLQEWRREMASGGASQASVSEKLP